MEDIPQFLSGDINEVDRLGVAVLVVLVSDEVLVVDVVVFAHQLHELEGSTIGYYALLVVESLVSVMGF